MGSHLSALCPAGLAGPKGKISSKLLPNVPQDDVLNLPSHSLLHIFADSVCVCVCYTYW